MIIVVIYVVIIIGYGYLRKVKCFKAFEEGAEDGLKIAYRLFPTLIGLVFAINIITNSGIIEVIATVIKHPQIVPEIILQAILRPLSSNSALVMMNRIFIAYGPDSQIGQLSSLIQGCSDTTIYIVIVYFGSIGITNIKYTIKAGLLTDLIAFLTAFLFGYLFL